MGADHVLGDAAYDDRLALRVDTLAPDPLAHLPVEALDEVVVGRLACLRRGSFDPINCHLPCFPRFCCGKTTQRKGPENSGKAKVVDNSRSAPITAA